MTGGVMDYLDACAGVTDEQWLDIKEFDFGPSEFWSVAHVAPWELRRTGDEFVLRWLHGLPPTTSMECWFRRVVRRMGSWKKGAFEPWVVLYAMAHAIAGRRATSPSSFATLTIMPMGSRDYAKVVSIARKEAPKSTRRESICGL